MIIYIEIRHDGEQSEASRVRTKVDHRVINAGHDRLWRIRQHLKRCEIRRVARRDLCKVSLRRASGPSSKYRFERAL